MNAPLTRDEQIELMVDAEARHNERMRTWIGNAQVRQVLARPAKGQEPTQTYVEEDKVVACCG